MAKGLDTPYRPTSGAHAWQKIRHARTRDAELLAVQGTPRRPEALMVAFEDGWHAVTSPRLTPVEARQLAEFLEGRLVPAKGGPVTLWAVTDPHPLVEVLDESGRHGAVRYVRLRPDE